MEQVTDRDLGPSLSVFVVVCAKTDQSKPVLNWPNGVTYSVR
jgi:hypothetical protein